MSENPKKQEKKKKSSRSHSKSSRRSSKKSITSSKNSKNQLNSNKLTPDQLVLKNITSVCHTHGEPIEYYCETCDEFTCENCFFIGAHATPVHLGRALDVIMEERMQKLSKNVNINIRILETDYLERLRICDRAHVHVLSLRKIINGKTINFFESLIHSIKVKNLEYLAKVNKAHSELQTDINIMNRVVAEANYLSRNKRKAEFLLRYRVLRDQAEFQISKKNECKNFDFFGLNCEFRS